jgi:hypothetical protein
VAETAQDVLLPVEDQDGRTSHFKIPPALIPLIRELAMRGKTPCRYEVLDARPYNPLTHREDSVGRSLYIDPLCC